MPLLSLYSAAMLCCVDPRGRLGLLFRRRMGPSFLGQEVELVRGELKVEVTPNRVECSREGIRRRVYGCPSVEEPAIARSLLR